MKALLALLTLATSSAFAGDFRFTIAEQFDDFTKSTYLRGDGLKVCQVKKAGFVAPCATLDLVWDPAQPNVVGVRLERPEISSITGIAVNINGEIQRFAADVPVTDFDYNESLGRFMRFMAWSSANTFVLPVDVLKAIASNKENGVIRVTGTHAATDYDFYRKAKARGLPADELSKFIERITMQATADFP